MKSGLFGTLGICTLFFSSMANAGEVSDSFDIQPGTAFIQVHAEEGARPDGINLQILPSADLKGNLNFVTVSEAPSDPSLSENFLSYAGDRISGQCISEIQKIPSGPSPLLPNYPHHTIFLSLQKSLFGTSGWTYLLPTDRKLVVKHDSNVTIRISQLNLEQ